MENNANYALVGLLSTALLVALFAFVYWFAGPRSDMDYKAYDVVFSGAVSGLNRGSDVSFNGIKVGQVDNLSLDPDNGSRVIARISVTENTPVRTDTKAMLGFQGLTGSSSLQLTGGTLAAGDLVAEAGQDVPRIYAENTDFQSLIDSVTKTVNGAATTVERLNEFLDGNTSRLETTLANIETFSGALAKNSDGIESFLGSVSTLGEQLGPMTSEISQLSSDLRQIVAAIPPEDVGRFVTNMTSFSDSLSRNAASVDTIVTQASELFTSLNSVSGDLTSTVKTLSAQIGPITEELSGLSTDLRQLVDAVPPEDVRAIVANVDSFSSSLARNSGSVDTIVAQASALLTDLNAMSGDLKTSLEGISTLTGSIDPEAISRVVDNVDRFSERLGANAENFDEIVDNVNALTRSLNASAAQVDTILAKVDGVVSGADDEGMFTNISEAAVSIRKLADDLRASTGQITSQLNDFTGRGLSQYTALAVDARATLQRLDRVVRNLEANPQSLVFGGETVREYNKR